MTTARSEDDDDGDHVQKVKEADDIEQQHRNKSGRTLKNMISQEFLEVKVKI